MTDSKGNVEIQTGVGEVKEMPPDMAVGMDKFARTLPDITRPSITYSSGKNAHFPV